MRRPHPDPDDRRRLGGRHAGQAEKVAQAVLGGLFVNALIGSVVTGFGINSGFADQALRRYAIGARDRWPRGT